MPVQIRRLGVDDVQDAMALSTAANWNQRPEDWRMLLRLAPAGAFAAVEGGRVIGTALGIDYERFGWIAMMLVDPSHRGRGLGARLLEAALGALPASAPVRLDATPLGQPLYERYGFAAERGLTRHVRPAGPLSSGSGATARAARPIAGVEDLPSIAALDRRVFGGVRLAVLEWSVEVAPQYAWVGTSGGAASYVLGRPGRLFDQIGPVVASDEREAIDLAGCALAAAAGSSTVVDAYDDAAQLRGWLRDAGFEPQRPLLRMCRPAGGSTRDPAGQPGDPPAGQRREFAIFGPEFA